MSKSRWKSEEKLREASVLWEDEERFRRVFEEGPLAMVLVDKGFRLTHVNSRFCEMLGYTEAELISRTFPEISHPDDIDKDIALAEQVFRGEIPYYTIEKRYLTKAGEVVWANLTAFVVRDEDGTPLYGLGMVEDITERKREQDELRRSEERFRMVLKAPVALFAHDRDLRFTWVHNPSSGFDSAALIGKTDAELVPPDQAAAPMALKRQVLETGKAAREEISLSINGETSWYDLHVEPHLHASGEVIGVTCIAIDTTERKQAEDDSARYRSMVTASSDLMVYVDSTYTYRAVNQAYCDEHQRTQEEILGRTVAEVFGEEAFETELKPHLDRCLSGERVNFEFWWDSPSRGRRHVEARYDPFFEADGSVSGVLVDVRDTTDQKRIEVQLEQSIAEAEAANRGLRLVSASLVHDLRNPLLTVTNFSKMLAESLGRQDAFEDSPDQPPRERMEVHRT